jgi:hypothetical protein
MIILEMKSKVKNKQFRLGNLFRRNIMSQLKSIIFMFLLCLLFSTTELFALDSNNNQQSLTQLNTGKKVVPEKNHWGIANIGRSLNNTLNRASKSLNGTTNRVKNSLDGIMGGIGKSLNGTMGGVRNSIDETMEGVGEFIDDAGDIAVVAGAVFIFIMAEDYYYYDHNCHGYHGHR